MQAVGPLSRLLCEAGVWCHHDEISETLRGDGVAENRQRIEVVYRHLEEALELRRMQVEGYDAVHPSSFDRVRAHPRPYRYARFVLLVALRVAEVRNDGCYRCGARSLERVDPEDQLHEVVV